MTKRIESPLRERGLGWFIRPEYPALGVLPPDAEIVDALTVGVCPFCGRGPFVVVLQHVRKLHGISHVELRDLAGITQHHKFTDATYSARIVRANRDRKPLGDARGSSGPKRRTRAVRSANAERGRNSMKFKPCSAPGCSNLVRYRLRETCSDECLHDARRSGSRSNRA